jgi:type I restriction enzyme, S subunit
VRKSWQATKLGDVAKFINGRAYKQNELLDAGRYPVLRVGNFFTNRNWYYSDLKLQQDKYCENGDLLYAWSASFGPKIWEGKKVIYHYHIWKIQPDPLIVDKRFLFHFLEWDKEKIQKEQGAGTTMVHVTKGSIENRQISLPSLPEQTRIVAILDEAFAGLATLTAIAEKNLRNAREIFESTLHSIFTARDEGWVGMTLKQMSTDFGRGKSKHRPRNAQLLYGGDFPLIQTGDVSNSDHFIRTFSQTYNEVGLAQSKQWPRGTVCIVIVGANIAETGILDFDACFPDSIIGLVANPKIATNEFVEYLLQSFKARIRSKGQGTARENINLGTFENVFFPVPDLATQDSVVARLNCLAETIKDLQEIYVRKANYLTLLKHSILKKAFTGELTSTTANSVNEAAE